MSNIIFFGVFLKILYLKQKMRWISGPLHFSFLGVQNRINVVFVLSVLKKRRIPVKKKLLFDEYTKSLWEVPEVRLLYFIFLAQDWRILSQDNRSYAQKRLGREPELLDLAQQWIDYGGLCHFRSVHKKLYEYASKYITESHFIQFQVFFTLAHPTLREMANIADGDVDSLFHHYECWLSSQMRKRFAGIVAQYTRKEDLR